jgi:hypothetical protein
VRLFQSERRLTRELSRILTSPQEKIRHVERRAQEDEEDFIVYLPSDLELSETSYHHYQLRDGAEIVLQV